MEAIKPKNLEEVLEYKSKYKGDAKIIAGGTDLIIKIRKGEENPKALIDISSLNELKGIRETLEYIEIGPATTFTEICECILLNKNLKGLKDAARSVGSPQIRNRGTVGGNICNASPAADTVPPLLALDSILVIEGKGKKREIYLKDFFKDKGRGELEGDEILTKIKFKNPLKNQGLGFYKLGLRKALAISRLSFAVFLEIDEMNRIEIVRIASGAIGKFPMRELEVEEYLTGRIINENTIEEAETLLERVIFERLKGRQTAKFKSIAAKGVFKKALLNALYLCKGVNDFEKN
ncbi:FAD binding domain-containing protein [Caloramator australicus]|uniref:Xanthine dehydrogenase, FAD binding subunit n=1 Tax=Caloramator australicus RC3 TaxID=857293 RepID=I7J4Y6_9CLOT|nr:xanthine dehydrogenase family protein subunit M [Caloramator australicus]CCJ33251.1 Xanthine dehydrogenase, FAD binding subunit [Caloramator australicus RC3]